MKRNKNVQICLTFACSIPLFADGADRTHYTISSLRITIHRVQSAGILHTSMSRYSFGNLFHSSNKTFSRFWRYLGRNWSPVTRHQEGPKCAVQCSMQTEEHATQNIHGVCCKNVFRQPISMQTRIVVRVQKLQSDYSSEKQNILLQDDVVILNRDCSHCRDCRGTYRRTLHDTTIAAP